MLLLGTTTLRTCLGSFQFQGLPRKLSHIHMHLPSASALHSIASDADASFQVRVQIESPEQMEDFGALLSRGTGAGDVLLLDGDLGAGKTCFSRGFIRSRVGRSRMRVTSPTFLLSNTYYAEDDYDGDCVEIHHMDVYRLSGSEDLQPLDLPRVFSECIALIEWPSQLGALTVPDERLELMFKIDEDEEIRYLDVLANGPIWTNRVQGLLDDGTMEPFLLSTTA